MRFIYRTGGVFCCNSVGAAAYLFPKNAIKMLSFSTSGKGSILLYPFRSSPLLAITFLYHPKDFFLYRAAALFEYREKHQ